MSRPVHGLCDAGWIELVHGGVFVVLAGVREGFIIVSGRQYLTNITLFCLDMGMLSSWVIGTV